jgi:hypothetical protein
MKISYRLVIIIAVFITCLITANIIVIKFVNFGPVSLPAAVIAMAIVLAVILVAFMFAQTLSRPILNLASVAQRFAAACLGSFVPECTGIQLRSWTLIRLAAACWRGTPSATGPRGHGSDGAVPSSSRMGRRAVPCAQVRTGYGDRRTDRRAR